MARTKTQVVRFRDGKFKGEEMTINEGQKFDVYPDLGRYDVVAAPAKTAPKAEQAEEKPASPAPTPKTPTPKKGRGK